MQYLRTLLIGSLLVVTTGCANGLNSVQKAELDAYEARGMAVQEKSPGAGAALGLLPGGGSFYGREYGFGVANLLLWPLSILWDPISGYDAARAINDDGGIAAAVPQLAERLGTAPVTNEPLVRRALNANLRLGTAAAVARIESFARDAAHPSDLRVEAASALGVWGAPSPMDRVDGFHHDSVTIAAQRPSSAAARPARTSTRRDAAAARAA